MAKTKKTLAYGKLRMATLKKCAKANALAKAAIILYIDQRAGFQWNHSVEDIVKQIGITEKTVKKYVKELVKEGILKKVPAANYTKRMKRKMAYYNLDNDAYEKLYWSEEEEQPGEQEDQGETANETADAGQGGNDYLAKGVMAPAEGGNDYPIKGVTATPSYDIKEVVEEVSKKYVQTSSSVDGSNEQNKPAKVNERLPEGTDQSSKAEKLKSASSLLK